jgi:cytochrome P450
MASRAISASACVPTGSPVFDQPSNAWLISRYAEVEALLRETRVSKNFQRATPTPFETSILFQNPPDHTRVRAILNHAFAGAAMQGLEDRVREIADSLIDRWSWPRSWEFHLPTPAN